MVVMGVDGSTSSSGWAIFDTEGTKRLDSGRIHPKDEDWRNRIRQEWEIFNQIFENPFNEVPAYVKVVKKKNGEKVIKK